MTSRCFRPVFKPDSEQKCCKGLETFSRTSLARSGAGKLPQIAGDNLTRIGPGRVAVREVVGPHAVVFTPPRQDMTADSIVEESGVDLVVGEVDGIMAQMLLLFRRFGRGRGDS